MPIYKPSELRQFLERLRISPKKRLSQNFLIDGNIIRKIVKTANVSNQDIILEIGPGPGSLSEALLDTGCHLIAVEKDVTLAQELGRLATDEKKLTLFCSDIMEFPFEEKLSSFLDHGKKAKVIANLPYHLTTPILALLITKRELFSTLYVMVQEEVARRFVAVPGTKDYSSFTLFLNFFSDPSYAFPVSRHCFYPEPGVDSAVVVLNLKEPPPVSNQDRFFILTRTAFSHRRKMLRSSLKELYPTEKVIHALEHNGLNAQARPEELSLKQWVVFFEELRKNESDE